MSTLKVANISDGVNTASMTDAVRGSARAWVNFDASGTILAAYNVSSVTDNGVGDFNVIFASPMVDASYSIAGACKRADTNSHCVVVIKYNDAPTTTGVHILTLNDVTTAVNATTASVIVFR